MSGRIRGAVVIVVIVMLVFMIVAVTMHNHNNNNSDKDNDNGRIRWCLEAHSNRHGNPPRPPMKSEPPTTKEISYVYYQY